MTKAVEVVRSGEMGVRAAAREYNVPRSTLVRRAGDASQNKKVQ